MISTLIDATFSAHFAIRETSQAADRQCMSNLSQPSHLFRVQSRQREKCWENAKTYAIALFKVDFPGEAISISRTLPEYRKGDVQLGNLRKWIRHCPIF